MLPELEFAVMLVKQTRARADIQAEAFEIGLDALEKWRQPMGKELKNKWSVQPKAALRNKFYDRVNKEAAKTEDVEKAWNGRCKLDRKPEDQQQISNLLAWMVLAA